jgi:hypothetical protein
MCGPCGPADYDSSGLQFGAMGNPFGDRLEALLFAELC